MHLYILASKQQQTNLGNISTAYARSLKSKFLLSVREDYSEQTPVWRGQDTYSSPRVWGVRDKIRGKVFCSFAGIPLGYAWRNKKKKTKEGKRPNESIWSKHKTQYTYNFYLVVRFRMVSFRGQRKLGPRPGTGLL